jgi:hypothetical protein
MAETNPVKDVVYSRVGPHSGTQWSAYRCFVGLVRTCTLSQDITSNVEGNSWILPIQIKSKDCESS